MLRKIDLDVQAEDLEAEAARLVALGAVRRQEAAHQEFGIRWILLADPEGNEVCVVPA